MVCGNIVYGAVGGFMNRENERTISGNQCDDATLDTRDVRGGGRGGEVMACMHCGGCVRWVRCL